MNSHNGSVATAIYLREQMTRGERSKYSVPVEPSNLPLRNQRELAAKGHTQLSKNAKCPCGSGKRFQRCHKSKA